MIHKNGPLTPSPRFILVLLVVVMLMAGCGKNVQETSITTESAAAVETPEETYEAAETSNETETTISDDEGQSEATTIESNQEDASPSAAAPSVNGKLSVQGTSLIDEAGNPVQLRGVSTHGIAWFPQYINRDCFSQLKQWGANVVRMAMYTAENGGYCTDGDREELLSLLDDGVRYAQEADMYIILDWHILSDGDPTQYQAEAEDFFNEISARYADCVNVLYEICNEPNGGTEWSTVKAYAEDILPIIRANAPDAVVMVGTPNWCQYLTDAAADPITDYDNVMYTLHFYAATHKQDLRDVYSHAIESGLPIFVSEYGLCEASGAGTIDTGEADAWVSLLNQNNTSYVLWSLCNKDESASILQADCTKTSGFTADDLSPVGQWLTEMLSGQTTEATENGDINENTDSEKADDPEEEILTDEFTATVECTQQWEENGTQVCLYRITLENGTDKNVADWSVVIELSGKGELTNSWNGEFTLSGSEIVISPVEWDAEIAAGASYGDIGFILKGAQVESVTADSEIEG